MNDVAVEQSGGKNSENIQNNDMSRNNIIIYNQSGLSLEEAKTIALDVYKAEEAKKYSNESWEITKRRVEELVTDFLKQAFDETPNYIQNLKKPSVQQSFLNAEKGYASDETGTTKNNYIDIMKSRLCADDRSILQIFEDEAIKLVEKLTKSQMNYLTFMFLTYSYPKLLNDIRNVIDYCNKLSELYDVSFKKDITLISLEAVGACTPLGGARSMKTIEQRFHEIIPGMFYKGQTSDEIIRDLEIEDINVVKPIITKYVWNNELLQIDAVNIETLKSSINKYELNFLEDKLIKMFNKQIMNNNEIKNKLIEINPKMQEILALWDDNDFASRRITPQGEIIAISNYNNLYNENIKFEQYIN